MIEALKNDEIIRKVGGRFKLAALMQKRWVELMQGSRPMVDASDEASPLDVIASEIITEKIAADLTPVPTEESEIATTTEVKAETEDASGAETA